MCTLQIGLTKLKFAGKYSNRKHVQMILININRCAFSSELFILPFFSLFCLYSDEVNKELRSALSHIKLSGEGVYVQASTLGSLEALLEFLRTSKIPVSFSNISNSILYIPLKITTVNAHKRNPS